MRSNLDIEVCALLREVQAKRAGLSDSDKAALEEYEKEVLGGIDAVMAGTKGRLQALSARASIRQPVNRN